MNINDFHDHNLFRYFSNQNNQHIRTDLETVNNTESSVEDVFDVYLRIRCETSFISLPAPDLSPHGSSDESQSRS